MMSITPELTALMEQFEQLVRDVCADALGAKRAKDAAYAERNKLVAALSKLLPSHLSRHPEDDVTWEDDWRWIVVINGPAGQMTWHIHDSERDQFNHLYVADYVWDGHTTEEKYQRLGAIETRSGAFGVRIEQVVSADAFAADPHKFIGSTKAGA